MSAGRARTFAARGTAGAVFAALAVACGDASYVYTGHLYVEARDCLGTVTSVDVVSGDPAADTCAPVCLVQKTAPDRQPHVYVSTVCGPYPYGFDTDGADPRCAKALAAFARKDTCLVDGGSTTPASDAGAVADAGRD